MTNSIRTYNDVINLQSCFVFSVYFSAGNYLFEVKNAGNKILSKIIKVK
jgi:hypothetical protein